MSLFAKMALSVSTVVAALSLCLDSAFASGEPLKIGVILSFSGPYAD